MLYLCLLYRLDRSLHCALVQPGDLLQSLKPEFLLFSKLFSVQYLNIFLHTILSRILNKLDKMEIGIYKAFGP